MPRKQQRNWFRILRDLMAAGVSMARIARLCGKSCAKTVQHWAEGGEPKDSDARIILALYRQHCPEKFEAHMREFEAEVLNYVAEAAEQLHGRAQARRIRRPSAEQFDFFVTEPA